MKWLRSTPWVLGCAALLVGVAAWTVQSYGTVHRAEFLFGVAVAAIPSIVAVMVGAARPWPRVVMVAIGLFLMAVGSVAAPAMVWSGGLTIVLVAALVARGPIRWPPRALWVAVGTIGLAVGLYAVTIPSAAPRPIYFAFPASPSARQVAFEEYITASLNADSIDYYLRHCGRLRPGDSDDPPRDLSPP